MASANMLIHGICMASIGANCMASNDCLNLGQCQKRERELTIVDSWAWEIRMDSLSLYLITETFRGHAYYICARVAV